VSTVKTPRKYWRRLCHRIVLNKKFDRFMLVIIFCDVFLLIIDMVFHRSLLSRNMLLHGSGVDYFFVITECFFVTFYIIECVMKIMAYSGPSLTSRESGDAARSGQHCKHRDSAILCSYTGLF
jgi:hypothetical protein